MTSKQSPTNLFRETNFEEINANLFVHAETKNMKSFEVFFSRCMTSFAAKKQFGTGVTELLFCIERDFVASFFKLIEETDSQRQIHFCAGAWLEFKRFWSLKKKKDYCACINAFLFKYAAGKCATSSTFSTKIVVALWYIACLKSQEKL